MMFIGNKQGNFKADEVLVLEGLVISSHALCEDRKIELLQFLAGFYGASPSEDSLRFAVRTVNQGGVW